MNERNNPINYVCRITGCHNVVDERFGICEECEDKQILDKAKREGENINPKHYQGKIQPIDLIEAQGLNFSRGNVVKYVCRADKKGEELEDLKKALVYLQREINKLSMVS